MYHPVRTKRTQPNPKAVLNKSKNLFSCPFLLFFPVKSELSADVKEMTLYSTPAIDTGKEQDKLFYKEMRARKTAVRKLHAAVLVLFLNILNNSGLF